MTHTAIETEVEVRYSIFSPIACAVHAEIEHLLTESNIRNVIVLEALKYHGAEVFAKTKQPGLLVLLSFNKCSIPALTAFLSVNRVNSNFSSQLRAECHCASPIQYHVFISCELHPYILTDKNTRMITLLYKCIIKAVL